MATLRKGSKRRVVATTGVLVLGAGVAFAYWTAGGAGTGTAATGTQASLVVKQTSTVSAMGPGIAPQSLSGNFDNPNSGPTHVGSVTVSIASVTKAVGAPAGDCDATDYTLANATMTVGTEVPAGLGKGAWGGATIAFHNKPAVNQDGCKGATVNLSYTVS
jgi:hypothetical protein